MNRVHSFLFFLSLITLFSCTTQREITYLQNIDCKDPEKANTGTIYEQKVQPSDILFIQVVTTNTETNALLNPFVNKNYVSNNDGYLVDVSGYIQFPLLGALKVIGQTKNEVRDSIQKKLEKYVVNPVVFVRISNFKITVLGEVLKPGVYSINNESISLTEALGLSGDLTIYAKRTNVLIIRQENGIKQYYKVDITKKDFLESNCYYLHNNDIIYVEPGKGKRSLADNFYKIAPIVISTLTLFSLVLINVVR